MSKFYVENLGCAKNQVDSEVVVRILEEAGWVFCDTPADCDLIIVNTCGFIESAKKESIDTFFAFRREFPQKKIVMSGCLAQRYGEALRDSLPEADGIFGNRDLSKVTVFASDVMDGKRPVLCPDYPDPEEENDRRTRLFNYPASAYLKISEGCNHRCAYCAIPLIRGALRSRPEASVLCEAKRLIETGIREINIIAQDLAAYGYDWDGKSHFLQLLEKLDSLDGDFAIRLLYIHPDWMSDDIICAVKRCKKVLHYFDIPFQHASEHVLKPMKRSGNIDSYCALVEKIRSEIPDAVIRTTLMLGFPGETEEDFETVRGFVKRCHFTWMGSFVYSLEEDTEAFALTTEKEHEVLAKKALRRQRELEKIQQKITEGELEKFVGNTYKVLIEENVEGEDLAIGRIYAQAPEVDGLTVVMGRNMVPGGVYTCGIRRVNGVDLEAVRID